jgi:hypothetical protein
VTSLLYSPDPTPSHPNLSANEKNVCPVVIGRSRRLSQFEEFVAAGCALWFSKVYEVMSKHKHMYSDTVGQYFDMN